MDFERIETLKRQFTDKYVVVDARRPELSRFRGQTGVVKTVNMSGRALVEFDAHLNIGWYDIALDFLKVIDAPLPKAEPAEAKADRKPVEKKAAPAPVATAGEKKLSPLEMARMQGAAKSSGAAKSAAAAPAQPVAKAAEAKPVAGKLSTADILAAARAKAGASVSPAAPTATAAPAKPAAPPAKSRSRPPAAN